MAKLDQSLVAAASGAAIFGGNQAIIRSKTFVRVVAPVDAAAGTLRKRYTVVVKHLLRAEQGARAFGES